MSESPLYDFAIPIFTNGLNALSHILDQAKSFAEEYHLDTDSIYPEARLVADQLPLVFQIQNATKTIRVNVDRLTGADSKPFEDAEKTFEDLQARIRAAAALLETVDAGTVNPREGMIVDV